MRVLVAYGSKRGGTAGIAQTIGDALSTHGLEVDIRPADARVDVDPYDAVIVGGALYATRWHAAARRFVRRRRRGLRAKSVWMFSSGPLDDSARERAIPPTRRVAALMRRVGARGHMTFGGRLAPDVTGFIASKMARKTSGDWRDTSQIQAWAHGIASELEKSTVDRVA